MDAQELRRLRPELESFLDRYAPLFGRPEPQAHARRFVQGLLLGGERRSVENIAEAVDGGVVRSLQSFIAASPWDADPFLAELRRQVAAEWGDPEAVVTVDETGFPKKGAKSVGVKRQYSGTLGRTDNCQVGVFTGYHAARGHTLLDRRLFLPAEWASDTPPPGRGRRPGGGGVPHQAGNWPWRWSLTPWRPGCRSGGWPAMRCTAIARRSAGGGPGVGEVVRPRLVVRGAGLARRAAGGAARPQAFAGPGDDGGERDDQAIPRGRCGGGGCRRRRGDG